MAGGRNFPAAISRVAMASIQQSREMRYQSLNEYRKRFTLKPFKSFEELTGMACSSVIAAQRNSVIGLNVFLNLCYFEMLQGVQVLIKHNCSSDNM